MAWKVGNDWEEQVERPCLRILWGLWPWEGSFAAEELDPTSSASVWGKACGPKPEYQAQTLKPPLTGHVTLGESCVLLCFIPSSVLWG